MLRLLVPFITMVFRKCSQNLWDAQHQLKLAESKPLRQTFNKIIVTILKNPRVRVFYFKIIHKPKHLFRYN